MKQSFPDSQTTVTIAYQIEVCNKDSGQDIVSNSAWATHNIGILCNTKQQYTPLTQV